MNRTPAEMVLLVILSGMFMGLCPLHADIVTIGKYERLYESPYVKVTDVFADSSILSGSHEVLVCTGSSGGALCV